MRVLFVSVGACIVKSLCRGTSAGSCGWELFQGWVETTGWWPGAQGAVVETIVMADGMIALGYVFLFGGMLTMDCRLALSRDIAWGSEAQSGVRCETRSSLR